MSSKREEIVVLGGGYAGALAANRLAGRGRRRVNVTLVDAKEEFVQRLRLHQVAAGQKVAEPPYKKLLRRKINFVRGWAELIDAERGVVELAGAQVRELPFDRLVYAVGSSVDTSTVPGVAENAKTLGSAAAARGLSHTLHYSSKGRVVAVVGGGMTGLELASEIATAYPDLRVKLVTSGQLGGWLSERARQHLARTLERQGVEVIEQVRVQSVAPDRLQLADGAEIPVGLAVWCGGFAASPLAANSGLATDELGRLVVDRALRSVSHPQIVAAGDAAATPAFNAGRPLRMCCQVAMPLGAFAADNVVRELRGAEPRDLHFGYIHQPISLGRRDGIVQFVDRADRPKESILTGRKAALYKEMISRGGLQGITFEKLAPGSSKWPFKEPKADALAQAPARAAS